MTKRKARPRYWILREVKSEWTLYFHTWTGIGPKSTEDIKKAERFATRREATQSPAYSFMMTFYEPHAVRKVDYCDRCDGRGWYEGGKTMQTTCGVCRGTGVMPA